MTKKDLEKKIKNLKTQLIDYDECITNLYDEHYALTVYLTTPVERAGDKLAILKDKVNKIYTRDYYEQQKV